jgi:hypothetical protein
MLLKILEGIHSFLFIAYSTGSCPALLKQQDLYALSITKSFFFGQFHSCSHTHWNCEIVRRFWSINISLTFEFKCCIRYQYLESFETLWWRRMEQIVGLTEKWRSITKSQGWNEHPTYNKEKEDWLDWLHLAKELPSKTCFWKKERTDVNVRKKIYTTTGWLEGNEMILEIESGSKRLKSVENVPWKRLWTCHKDDYMMTIGYHVIQQFCFICILVPPPSIFSSLTFHHFLLLLLFFLLILFLLCFFFFFTNHSYLSPKHVLLIHLPGFNLLPWPLQTFIWTVLCWFCKWSSYPFLHV